MGWAEVVVLAYFGVLIALLPHGLHKLWMVWALMRVRRRERPTAPARWPQVTVQLPMFNERDVAERLIRATARLDYPRDRLHIQVLDDSLDDTCEIAREAVEALRESGLDVVYIHRVDRTGFKAGALEAGVVSVRGDFVAIFDADFIPPTDFLRSTLPWFSEGVGMVQVRWGHLNPGWSWLTRVQATLLDGHFVIEHAARHLSGRWFNFNGTAGVWRIAAIRDAGGWQHDTLTEDLDLSYRAQLEGWNFIYLDQVIANAELPQTMAAFKSQQHRWAKGSVQTCRKLLRRIWTSSQPLSVKLEAAAHLTANFSYPVVLVLTLLLPWAAIARTTQTDWYGIDVMMFLFVVVPFILFYGQAVRCAGTPNVWRRWLQLPLVLAVGVGMAVAQTRAVLEGCQGEVGEFVRTPKSGDLRRSSYRVPVHWVSVIELGLAVYLVIMAGAVIRWGHLTSLPFLALFAIGYGAVGGTSWLERRRGAA